MNVKLTNRSFEARAKLDPRRHLTLAGKVAQFEDQGLVAGTQEMTDALLRAGFTEKQVRMATEARE